MPDLVAVAVNVDTTGPTSANQPLRPSRKVEAKPHRGDKIWEPHPENHRCGDIILLSSVTQVNPVSKGGDHVESEGVEKAQRHLSISGTARSILDGDHGAEEEEDDRQVGETLLGETSEGCDDDPDVGAKEGKEDATVISRMPGCLCLLAVTEEGVEGSTVDHANLVGEKLETGCNKVKLVSQVALMSEAIVKEKPEKEKKTKQVGPDVHSLVVYLEDASQTGGIPKGLPVAAGDANL